METIIVTVPHTGILIVPHKKHCTKKIYANGHLMRSYKRCPFPNQLQFKSHLVNDLNQDLCEGWHRFDIEDQDIFTISRVACQAKPFGSIGRLTDTPKAVESMDILEKCAQKTKFQTKRYQRKLGSGSIVECLDVCLPGTLGELFDIDALADDYSKLVSPGLGSKIKQSKNISLDSFLENKWDDMGWLTGLILGYPVENTISCCYRNG